ncbi:uncharacterized protein LOC122565701 isoform X2 [Bombus pyrosoma]|uniref:uncharacterized protein LOC122565701 isoform X2 n=1 Tax=Bombus pyrosoma TaxID=396416 RepID=UPI001CB9919B|nr:uncharacterized protein LOC122565701 isoform X2 [Bombus pyrosoma]
MCLQKHVHFHRTRKRARKLPGDRCTAHATDGRTRPGDHVSSSSSGDLVQSLTKVHYIFDLDQRPVDARIYNGNDRRSLKQAAQA